ncbi:MAG: type III polyketide synthase [Acidimicrobiia bacterium]|nr:type III polyketide synthase [Acidimicrobiia bacterium]
MSPSQHDLAGLGRRARVTGAASALPAPVSQAALWRDVFAHRYGGSARAEAIWSAVGVETRHAAIDPRLEDVSSWGTGARMQRYVAEALPLATDAAAGALAAAGVRAEDVGLLALASCTGYATPGLDILAARELGLPDGLQRLLVGHMGCYAAVPALGAVADAVTARGLVSLLVCVELPSLHVQAPCPEVQQVVAHALFSDAATAVVVDAEGAGLEVLDLAARTDVEHHRDMTWDVTDLGFRMGLSPRVPQVLARHVRPLVDELLGRHGLRASDVAGWAIHPGGPRIVEVCADRLGLDDADVAASLATLRDHGNCSSATVLLVLEELRRTRPLAPGEHVVALAFGPGLTLYGALLRQAG